MTTIRFDPDLTRALDEVGWNADAVDCAKSAMEAREMFKKQREEERLDLEGRLVFKICFVEGLGYSHFQDALTASLCVHLFRRDHKSRFESFTISQLEITTARGMVEIFSQRFREAKGRLTPLMLTA